MRKLLSATIVAFYSILSTFQLTNSTAPEKVFEAPEAEIVGICQNMEITAYCGCSKCCGKSDGITASGVKAMEGVTIAADKSIPFGTEIVIDGKTYIVQDRGGAIKGNRIDIYFDSHEKALQYGRQTKEVTILRGE